MKKIYRFKELETEVQETMISKYIEEVVNRPKLLRAFAKEYFMEFDDAFDEKGNLKHYL